MKFYEEKGIGFCGLACVLCKEESCPGCKKDGCIDKESCSIYKCCRGSRISGCWECSEFPCNENMLQNHRVRGFIRYVKLEGIDKLIENLKRNYNNGIIYHSEELKGDYDNCSDEEEVMRLIECGKNIDPSIDCH